PRLSMKALLWGLMMLVWLGGLLFGLWWVWPRFAQPRLDGELVMIVIWLITGAVAWLVALNLGRQRYWRR
ncbi:MAG: hypothetical protein M3O34_09530, partial [Chloroflexota bacterium]|nr:hypothetical protein [Chloroflexota bacterium]